MISEHFRQDFETLFRSQVFLLLYVLDLHGLHVKRLRKNILSSEKKTENHEEKSFYKQKKF